MLTRDRIGVLLAIVAGVVGLVLVFGTHGSGDDDDDDAGSPPATSQVQAPAPGQDQAPTAGPEQPGQPSDNDDDDDG